MQEAMVDDDDVMPLAEGLVLIAAANEAEEALHSQNPSPEEPCIMWEEDGMFASENTVICPSPSDGQEHCLQKFTLSDDSSGEDFIAEPVPREMGKSKMESIVGPLSTSSSQDVVAPASWNENLDIEDTGIPKQFLNNFWRIWKFETLTIWERPKI